MAFLGKFFGKLRTIAEKIIPFRRHEEPNRSSDAVPSATPPDCAKGKEKPSVEEKNGEHEEQSIREEFPSEDIEGYGKVKIIKIGEQFKISVDETEYTLHQFSKRYDIRFSTLYGRIKKGWGVREVLAKSRKTNRDYQKNPPCRAKLWEWKGEKHSIAEWAKIYGIKKEMMRRRLRNYGSPEKNTEKFDTYQANRAKKYEWNGETHSIREWAQIYNVPERTMYGRIKKYGIPELPKAPEPREESDDACYGYDGEWKTISEWAEDTGLPTEQVKKNFKLYGEPCKPDVPQDEMPYDDEDDGEDEDEIDKLLEEYKPKRQKKESVKELLERIKNEPDDGRPLRDILGLPKAKDPLEPQEPTCASENFLV